MKLSVVIVNYNVQYFLESCLLSVLNAGRNIDMEVFVVDNNSVDGSVQMIKDKFPWVKLIESKENLGFSRGNNLAIKQAVGEYILLLNPDTVVEEATFEKVVNFMDEHPDGGGLGVKMVDGKGVFLPESKRGLPTPWVAFYKIFGLSRVFPKSKKFGKYHLGYLDKDETHEVEILSGAFMLLRKSLIDKIGSLDETFFMYGEDIDLSYRITKAGYKNYYFADTTIIHYKGESTKKSSVNYVFVFYKAMKIFAEKHFSEKHASSFSSLINLAIYFRAFLAILNRFVKRMAYPLMDFTVMFGGYYALKEFWENNYRSLRSGGEFPEVYLKYFIPGYVLVWCLSIFLSGGYDKPRKLAKVVKGIIIGLFVVLVIYGLLDNVYRHSRILILTAAAWSVFSLVLYRLLVHFIRTGSFDIETDNIKRVGIVGSLSESKRVEELLSKTKLTPNFIGYINPTKEGRYPEFIGELSQLRELINIYKLDQVIFCAKDIPAKNIIDKMMLESMKHVDFKIAPPESLFIIGSNSIDKSGDLYIIDINGINKPMNKRNKRMFDIMTSVLLFCMTPFLVFIIKKPANFLINLFNVIIGKYSWVGYKNTEEKEDDLPTIKSGILTPADGYDQSELNEQTLGKLNVLYAKDYKVSNDLSILLRGLKHLGR